MPVDSGGTRHSITALKESHETETTSLVCMAIMKSKKPDMNALTKVLNSLLHPDPEWWIRCYSIHNSLPESTDTNIPSLPAEPNRPEPL